MKIIAVRHLPTLLNKSRVIQGRSDIRISIGKKEELQIEKNLRFINLFPFTKVIVSPLIRTQESAKAYGFNNYIIDEKITEFDFGKYEKLPKSILLNEIGDQWLNEFDDIKFGEPINSFKNRINLFLEENSKIEYLLLFSHGVVIRYLMALSNLDSTNLTNRIVIENNSVNLIEFQ